MSDILVRRVGGTFAPDDGHPIGVGLRAVAFMVTMMIVGIITGGKPPDIGLRRDG
jgi:hypothetical protein